MAAAACATTPLRFRPLLRRLPALAPPTTRPLSTAPASLPIVDIGPLRDPNASPESRLRVAEALHKVKYSVDLLIDELVW